MLGLVVTLVGSYSVYSILWHFYPAGPRIVAQLLSLGIDVLLSFTLIVLSGGLDIPFLIYSLSPILTASLLMNLGFAVAIAGILALAVSGVHVLAEMGISNVPWILSRNYLVLSLLYSAVCLLIANLSFLANLTGNAASGPSPLPQNGSGCGGKCTTMWPKPWPFFPWK